MSKLFSGFMDYGEVFEDSEFIWTFIGTIFYLIAFVSFIPETLELVENKTDFGLSYVFVFGNSMGQWLLVVNFLCLNYGEFLGMFGYNFKKTYPSLLVFLELFSQWILFLPAIYLTIILDDREHEKGITPKQRLKNRITCCGLVILNVILSTSLLLLWAVIGTQYGFDTVLLKRLGDFCGYMSVALQFIQYIPQYITTIKIKSNGSLSLLMLEIQGPSAIANGLYMAVARHESPSTYLTLLVEGSAQIGLIILCMFFKLQKRFTSKETDYSSLSSLILEPIEAPINYSKESMA